jgi:hypothetical protein
MVKLLSFVKAQPTIKQQPNYIVIQNSTFRIQHF